MAEEYKQINPLELPLLAGRTNGDFIPGGFLSANIKDLDGSHLTDPRWQYVNDTIDINRWSKLYPYQFILLERTEQGYMSWPERFTLPIPPQDMTISTPFAITSTTLVDGYVEEHNGANIRMISLSGTTGIMPSRGTGGTLPKPASVIDTIAGGTVKAYTNLSSAVGRISNNVNKLSIDSHLVPDELDKAALPPEIGRSSGYVQFRLLQLFLESYAYRKKLPQYKSLRLGLACWKDESVYLVTPLDFEIRRTSSAALEYMYSIKLKAWGRVQTDAAQPDAIETTYRPSTRDRNALLKELDKINQVMDVLTASADVVDAVRADVNALLDIGRRTTGMLKSISGVAVNAADLPATLLQDIQSSVIAGMSDARSVAANITALAQTDERIRREWDSLRDLGNRQDKDKVNIGTLKQPPSAGITAHEGHTVFDDPDKSRELFKLIQVDDLPLTIAARQALDGYFNTVKQINRQDLENMRDKAQYHADKIEAALGLVPSTAAIARGIVVSDTLKPPADSDWDVLYEARNLVLSLSALCAVNVINRDIPAPLDYVAGLADKSGIAFVKPASKFLAPYPYGYTLEQVAQKYLGDPNRWLEIVELNGLRRPFVDEVGFFLPLISNGNGHEIIVATDGRLEVGQQVWVSSSNVSRNSRHIVGIRTLDNTMVLTLDGNGDLAKYQVLANAEIQAFLPGTTNSQKTIYIPSTVPATDDDTWKSRAVPGVDMFDELVRVGGVDLLLNSTNDLVLTDDLDCRLAVGLQALVQKVRLAITTVRGSLLHYPQYGVGLPIGKSIADIDFEIIRNGVAQAILADPSFSRVDDISVIQKGPGISVSFTVRARGVSKNIPLSFDVS